MDVVKQNALALKQFNEKKFNPVTVYGTDQMKVIVAYFRKGQFIPIHTPGVDVVFCILEGRAELVAGDKRFSVGPNDLVVVPKGVKRGIKALSELTVLHVVQPAPSKEDHSEVHDKLDRGDFELTGDG